MGEPCNENTASNLRTRGVTSRRIHPVGEGELGVSLVELKPAVAAWYHHAEADHLEELAAAAPAPAAEAAPEAPAPEAAS